MAKTPEEMRAYKREWARKKYWRNPEKARAHLRDLRARNPEKTREYAREWRERGDNREKRREGNLRYSRRRRVRAYQNKQSRERNRRRREQIPAPRRGQPWTAEEDAVVVRDDITLIEMCFLTGRSYPSVAHRRNKAQDVKRKQRDSIPGPRNKKRWTAEEDAVVVRDDITLIEMPRMVGRSYAAVSSRRGVLRRRSDNGE